MPIISYADFDRFRLREFAAYDASYCEEEEEHGMAMLEAIRGVSFARLCNRAERLYSIGIQFRYAPPEVAQAVLRRLGFAFLPFDSQVTVVHLIGAFLRQETWPPDYRVAFFEVGDTDRYALRCGFGNDDRLDGVDLRRLDFHMEIPKLA